jgi:HK97 family phage portal protein
MQPAQRASKGSAETISASSVFDSFVFGGATTLAAKLSEAEQYWFFAEKHPYIGSCVSLIAGALAASGYEIVAPGADMDQTEVDADPRTAAIKFIFDNPNNDQSFADVIEQISMDMDVVGKAYVHILRLPGGQMVGFERIDSRTMAPILSDDGTKIIAFKQRVMIKGQTSITSFDPQDIVFFYLPGAKDVTGGASLMDRLDFTVAVDMAARRHNVAYFKNGAKPGLILVNKKLNAEQMDISKKEIALQKKGTNNAYDSLLLAGDWEVTLVKTDGDEEFGKGQDRARQDICSVYHVPESKLKTTEGALGGNGKDQDDQTFHEECVFPRAMRIFRTFTRRILRDELGITDLELRPKAKYAIRQSSIADAVTALQSGASINEARALVGWPKSADQNADYDRPYVSTLVTGVQNPTDPIAMAEAQAKAHAAFFPPGHPAGPPADPAPAGPGDPKPGDPKPGKAKKAAARTRAGRFRDYVHSTKSSTG